jgi:Tol biopolymer transport system component
MNTARITFCCGLGLIMATATAAAQPPSYATQIRPFFARYCLECHSGDMPKGDLNLETFKALQEGGKSGAVVVPGKPDESRLVLLAEGKEKLVMPPKMSKQPRPEEVALLRAWVAAGAKDDGGTIAVAIPDIKPRVPMPAAITALAYHPKGGLLAAGGHKEVLLLDLSAGEVVHKLDGQPGEVTALAFSRDGNYLAAASGASGSPAQVKVYSLVSSGIPAANPQFMLTGHKDAILDIAWSPDNKILATSGYDRLIKLWDALTGKEIRSLRDHSDAVYGLAFSPDGKYLASGAADRAVKVWEVATGIRLFSLGEATDWVYAVAWSPDGRHIAAAGVDRSIRVWSFTPTGGKIVHSVFAHEGPITRLIYAPNGTMLYSLSEDRTAKAWDPARMTELRVYPRQPEIVLAMALRPDGKQLALSRYDGAVVLLDEASGKTQDEPLPVKPRTPQLAKLMPAEGQRGQTIRITLEGKYLNHATEVTTNLPGFKATLVPEGRTSARVQVDVAVPSQTAAGVYQLGVKGPAGQTGQLPFIVDLFPQMMEKEPNDSPVTGQRVSLPATIVGTLNRAGDVDYFRFEAQAGQEIGIQALTSALASKVEPVLQLTSATGTILAESTEGALGYTCKSAGIYAVGIFDRDYRGGPDMKYRLHIGDIPVVTALYPLGLQRGSQATIHVEGVHLGPNKSVPVKTAADAALGSRLPVPVVSPKGAPLGKNAVVVGEFPEVVRALSPPAAGPTPTLPVPGTANGRIDAAGAIDTWRFAAKRGQRLILEVNARRIGSPLDSYIEVLDVTGRPVPRATLRCLAKTFSTFRDHDSSGSGIRIEAWSELAIDDYILVGDELTRIWELPRNPDDDCQFYSAGGKRLGFLDTTPTHHSLGTPMYKVAIHPPGTMFAPNGLPVIALFYRNDDGGPGYGKDSRLFFDPPADGDYLVRIGDSRNFGGSNYGYRLTVRPPRPSFNVNFNPTAPAVWKGGAIPVTVTADRLDGFDGAISVHLENLPPGFSAPPTTIPSGENSTAFSLWADATATTPTKAPPLRLVARAAIAGQEVVREVTGGLPKVMEPGDLVTTTQQNEISLQPGGQVYLTATIERRNGFGGRVPLDVKGLPHGVRVLDIGLNGILVTEKETSRAFAIYAEPWVKPIDHPFVVLARREGKNTEHAAKSVLLRVTPK